MFTICTVTFRQFLELKFLEWQQESGGRKTVLEFAKYLGVSQQTVSSWWNNPNKIPDGANVEKLAKKLGLDVYDALGLPRPDEHLHYIQALWDSLTAEERRSVREQAEKYVSKNDARRVHKKRRTSTP